MSDLHQARELLIDKSKEYGLRVASLHLLDAAINIEREIETKNKVPQQEKRSIGMERIREKLQHELQSIKEELDSLVELLKRMAQNG
jgi:hypothetical protein